MQALEMVRGNTAPYEISLLDPDGNPYILGSGEKLIFGVKSNYNNDAYDVEKVATSENLESGSYVISLDPEDTIELPIGSYYYDVGLQTADGGFYTVVKNSPFILQPNVTKKEVV